MERTHTEFRTKQDELAATFICEEEKRYEQLSKQILQGPRNERTKERNASGIMYQDIVNRIQTHSVRIKNSQGRRRDSQIRSPNEGRIRGTEGWASGAK